LGAWSCLARARSRPTHLNASALSARPHPLLLPSSSSIPVASHDDRVGWQRSSAGDSKPPRERLNPERVRRRLSRRRQLRAPRERHVLSCEVYRELAARSSHWLARIRIALLPQSSRTRWANSRVDGHRQHLKPRNPELLFPLRPGRATRLVQARTAFRPEAEVGLARAERAPDRQVRVPGSAAPRVSSLRVVGDQLDHEGQQD
jgi:hypothetical protein